MQSCNPNSSCNPTVCRKKKSRIWSSSEFRPSPSEFRPSPFELPTIGREKNQEYDQLLHAIRIPIRCNHASRILQAIPLYIGKKNHEYDRLRISDPPLSSFPLQIGKKNKNMIIFFMQSESPSDAIMQSELFMQSHCVSEKKITNMIVFRVNTLPFRVQTLPFRAFHYRSEKTKNMIIFLIQSKSPTDTIMQSEFFMQSHYMSEKITNIIAFQSSDPSLQSSGPPLSTFPLYVGKKSRIWLSSEFRHSPSEFRPSPFDLPNICRKKITNMIVFFMQSVKFYRVISV